MQTRCVFFDLGNVLVNFDHQIAVRQLSELADRPETRVRHVLFDSGLQEQFETGHITGVEFAGEVNRGLERDIPTRDVLEAISAIFEPNHAILPALEAVKAAGIPLGVLSNTCEAHWQWIIARNWPMLVNWFGLEILSYQVRSMKPAGQIYQVCEERSGCAGSAIFFTDDREENIEAAERRGWTTYHFQSAPALIARLKQWL